MGAGCTDGAVTGDVRRGEDLDAGASSDTAPIDTTRPDLSSKDMIVSEGRDAFPAGDVALPPPRLCVNRPPPTGKSTTALLSAVSLSPAPEPAPVLPGSPRGLPTAEIARRLAAAFWNLPADSELVAWVAECAPRYPSDMALLAELMLKDPRALGGAKAFLDRWLGLDEVARLQKDDAAFTPTLRAAMQEETARFLIDVILSERSTLPELFSRTETFVDSELASIYGVPAPQAAGFSRVALDATRRAGLLTHASVLAKTSLAGRNQPTRRGAFVYGSLFCFEIPPDIVTTRPGPPPNVDARAWLIAETASPECRQCHGMFDPIGLRLDDYDPIGRAKLGPSFDPDIQKLGQALGNDEEAFRCFTVSWLRHASRRMLSASDPSVRYVITESRTKGGRLLDVLLASAASQAFLEN